MEKVITILSNIMFVFIAIFVVVAVITIFIRNRDVLTEMFFTRCTIFLEIIVITLAYSLAILGTIIGNIDTSGLVFLSIMWILATALSIKGIVNIQ